MLSRLPPAVVLPRVDSPLVALLASEISEDSSGQAAVLDRLLDLLLVTCLRQVFSTRPGVAPQWYAAQEDPVVGTATRLLHHPAQPWTVASLPRACGGVAGSAGPTFHRTGRAATDDVPDRLADRDRR